MKTPVVLIHTNLDIDDYYKAIKHSLDQRFHNYQSHFPEYPISEKEYGRLESDSASASHGSDGVIVNGHMASVDGGQTWTHIERLVR